MTRILHDGSTIDDLTPIKMIDGKYYLLTPEDIDQQEIDHQKAQQEAPFKRKKQLINAPRSDGGYGTAEEQLDFIAATGLQNWLFDRATRAQAIAQKIDKEFGGHNGSAAGGIDIPYVVPVPNPNVPGGPNIAPYRGPMILSPGEGLEIANLLKNT